ncbi:hypothetical protein TNCV_1147841 [Trichonephila clavipes]|nr:hypothetical protein TNCV_1147841 [Trichonephila clavipes]
MVRDVAARSINAMRTNGRDATRLLFLIGRIQKFGQKREREKLGLLRDDSLRRRAVGRFEAGYSQAEEAQGLPVVSKLYNPFQTMYCQPGTLAKATT